MKRIATILAALGLLTTASVASAWEFVPGATCANGSAAGAVSPSWTGIYANTDAWIICPVTRTYQSVSTAKADIYNPSGKSTSGWINFISEDGSYTNYNQASTNTAGNQVLNFKAISNPRGVSGFVAFDLSLPAGASVRGVFSN